jgi:arginine/lysine/ornithine decarboxylase
VVDNAHGAYLKFLSPSRHPIDLGADIVCDSAHKTLPVLTGGGYLHVSNSAPRELVSIARSSMELFGSTSPSYLILESLDLCNAELASGYAERIADFALMMAEFKAKLNTGGYYLSGNEPFKVTIDAKSYGYLGTELARILEELGVYPEFSDPDYLVLMLTPDSSASLDRIAEALLGIEKREPITDAPPTPSRPVRAILPRDAMLSATEQVPTADAEGRILAIASVGCPPAIPIAVSGEIIDETTRRAFEYYGIDTVCVVK